MRPNLWLCLIFLCFAISGCAAIAEALFKGVVESACHTAYGESEEERQDRQEMERYREHWDTPGRSSSEIEREARGKFRKKHGRDPNLNWHERENYPVVDFDDDDS